jgi:hypothetical protein
MCEGKAGHLPLTTSVKRFEKRPWQDRGNEGSSKAASGKLTARRHPAPEHQLWGLMLLAPTIARALKARKFVRR